MDTDSKAYFMAATIVIRVPTGVKIFGWLGHLSSNTFENCPHQPTSTVLVRARS